MKEKAEIQLIQDQASQSAATEQLQTQIKKVSSQLLEQYAKLTELKAE